MEMLHNVTKCYTLYTFKVFAGKAGESRQEMDLCKRSQLTAGIVEILVCDERVLRCWDYISSEEVEPPQHPRKALRAISERWLQMVGAWQKGEEFPGIAIGDPHPHKELAPLLESRAELLLGWSADDSFWEEG
jgi:hypothetical protein